MRPDIYNHVPHDQHHYIDPDYRASFANDQLPILSTVGRGPRGKGVTAAVIQNDDGNFTFVIIDDTTNETIFESPNLSPGKLSVYWPDQDIVPGTAAHWNVIVEKDGVTETYTLFSPPGHPGSRIFNSEDHKIRTSDNTYVIARSSLVFEARPGNDPYTVVPRVNDVVIFEVYEQQPNEVFHFFCSGHINAVTDTDVIVVCTTYIDFAGGEVNTVDGIAPDLTGDVELLWTGTQAEFDALPKPLPPYRRYLITDAQAILGTLPPGGDPGDYLVKQTADDFDATWEAIVTTAPASTSQPGAVADAKATYDAIQAALQAVTGGLAVPIQLAKESDLPATGTADGEYYKIQLMDVSDTTTARTGEAWWANNQWNKVVNAIDGVPGGGADWQVLHTTPSGIMWKDMWPRPASTTTDYDYTVGILSKTATAAADSIPLAKYSSQSSTAPGLSAFIPVCPSAGLMGKRFYGQWSGPFLPSSSSEDYFLGFKDLQYLPFKYSFATNWVDGFPTVRIVADSDNSQRYPCLSFVSTRGSFASTIAPGLVTYQRDSATLDSTLSNQNTDKGLLVDQELGRVYMNPGIVAQNVKVGDNAVPVSRFYSQAPDVINTAQTERPRPDFYVRQDGTKFKVHEACVEYANTLDTEFAFATLEQGKTTGTVMSIDGAFTQGSNWQRLDEHFTVTLGAGNNWILEVPFSGGMDKGFVIIKWFEE